MVKEKTKQHSDPGANCVSSRFLSTKLRTRRKVLRFHWGVSHAHKRFGLHRAVRTHTHTTHRKPTEHVAYMIGFTALWSLPFTRSFSIPRGVLSPLLYLALVATTLTIWLQLQGQKNVSATTAAYIFAFEPIFAYLFAHFTVEKNLTTFGNIGALLIFLSALLVQYGEYRTSKATGS